MKTQIQKIKVFLKKILRKEVWVKKDFEIKTQRYGSVYGGWEIRKDSVSEESVVYSFGVGEDASFDVELIKKHGVAVHAFDPTPKSIAWAKSNISESQFILHEYGLAGFDGEVQFSPPSNPEHVSHTILERKETGGKAITVPVKCMKTIINELGHSRIDILKMDIEGAEYAVVDDLIQTGILPKQLLVEYHHRFPNVGLSKTYESIDKLREAGYRLFAISPTNQEFSFELE